MGASLANIKFVFVFVLLYLYLDQIVLVMIHISYICDLNHLPKNDTSFEPSVF